MIDVLKFRNKKYVSYLEGGFEVLSYHYYYFKTLLEEIKINNLRITNVDGIKY
jgi:hypothetical protein